MIENPKKRAYEPQKPPSQLEKWQVDAGINEILLETPVNISKKQQDLIKEFINLGSEKIIPKTTKFNRNTF